MPTPQDADTTADALRRLLAAGQAEAACDMAHHLHAADVRRFVASLRPAQSIDDVCQDVWMRVLKALPRFRFEASLRVWVFTIAKHRVAEGLRRNRGRRFETWDSSAAFLARFDAGARPPSPSSEMARRERAAALQRALARLPAPERELLELRYVLDLKPREIVGWLEPATSANVVSQRLVRAGRALRAELAKEAGFAEPR